MKKIPMILLLVVPYATLIICILALVGISMLVISLVRMSSAMFGISGFRWCRKYGTLSKAAVVFSSIAQFIPCVDVVGSILCYIMFRKEGQTPTPIDADFAAG